MKSVQNYSEITDAVSSVRAYKDGFLTNFYIGEERCNLLIHHGLLYKKRYERCIFILP